MAGGEVTSPEDVWIADISSGAKRSMQLTKRQREWSSRSRSGCLTCRQRHVRCDEHRPTCNKCQVGGRSCEYSSAAVPLRDRRKQAAAALPGEQAPWAVAPESWKAFTVVISGNPDPFESLPIKMSLRSTELLRFYHSTAKELGITPLNGKDDCLVMAVHDESSLRNSLLLAGIHHSWKTYGSRDFESTYLLHKVEGIKHINTLLSQLTPKTWFSCFVQVATQSLVAACSGNLPEAESHLEGMLTLCDFHDQFFGYTYGRIDARVELASRYLGLVYNFVHAFKSRARDYAAHSQALGTNGTKHSDAHLKEIMHIWHMAEDQSLRLRLKVNRLLPHFFSVPDSGRDPRPVEGFAILDSVREISAQADLWNNQHFECDVWQLGAPARLLESTVLAHVQSYDQDGKDPKFHRFPTSWIAMSAPSGLYIHCVCNIANEGKPMSRRLLHRVLTMQQRDLERAMVDNAGQEPLRGTDSASVNLSFWSAFVSATAIARNAREAGENDSGPSMTQLRAFFDERIRAWSEASGVKDWPGAKAVLKTIVWSETLPQSNADAQTAWTHAMQGASTPRVYQV